MPLGLIAVELLKTSAFWSAIMLGVVGYLLAGAKAFWVPGVLAGLYTAHYYLIQDAFGDSGPFVWRNWMAFGLVITALLGGFAAQTLTVWRQRPLPTINRVYLAGLLIVMALSVLTFGSRSFQSQDAPWQYNREWVLTLATCAFISVLARFLLRPFLWTLLVLGLVAIPQMPAYWGTVLGANLSASMVLGVFSAAILFKNPWLIAAVSAPLVIGTLLLMKEGSLVGLVAGAFVLLVLRTRGTPLARLPYVAAGSLVLLIAGVWVVLGNARLWDQILHRGMDVRIQVYGEFIRMWLESPITGIGQVSPSVPRPAQMYAGVPGPIYAHNPILEILGSWGLIGLALWGTLQVIGAMKTYRAGLLPMWSAAFAFALSSGDLSGNPRYWILGAVGVALGIQGGTMKTTPGQPSELPAKAT